MAWTRVQFPGTSLSQKAADARSSVKRSMVLFTAPMRGSPSLVAGHGRSGSGPGSFLPPGDRAGFRNSGKPTNFPSADWSSNRYRMVSFRCPRHLSPDPSLVLYPTCRTTTPSVITVCQHPVDHKNPRTSSLVRCAERTGLTRLSSVLFRWSSNGNLPDDCGEGFLPRQHGILHAMGRGPIIDIGSDRQGTRARRNRGSTCWSELHVRCLWRSTLGSLCS